MQRDQYGQATPHGWEVDHVKPVSKGDSDDLANFQTFQWESNRHKSDNHPNRTCKVTARWTPATSAPDEGAPLDGLSATL